MTVTIRPVAQADRAKWEDLFEAYAQFYKTTIPEGAFDTVWEWIFDPENKFWCDVAQLEDGRVVGFTQYQQMQRSLSGGMVIYLGDLFVEPEVRGTGAGRKLIDHVVDAARGMGISNVRWLTQEFNYTARKLYDTYQPKSDFILYSIPVEG